MIDMKKIYVVYEDMGIFDPVKYTDRDEAEAYKNYMNKTTDMLFCVEEEESE